MKQFLKLYEKKGTRKAYRTAINQYLQVLYGERDKAQLDKLSIKYLTENRDKFDDLVKFLEDMKTKYTPKTIGVKIAGVREWLGVNDYEPSPKEKRILKKLTPASKPMGEEEIFTRENIRKILNHLPVHGKALMLLLASSGMRIGETLLLELEDIKLEENPVRIVIRGENTKTGESRISFMSSEAVEVLKEWLNVRNSYLKASQNKNKGLVSSGNSGAKLVEDNRLFPFSTTVVLHLFHNALDKAGLNGKDRETRRLKYRIHGLRKFFRSQLATAIPVDIVESLMGHEGYLTGEYRRYTEKELGEYYTKGEHILFITPPESMVKIASEVKHGLEKNRELVENLIIENRDLMDRLGKVEEELKTLDQVKTLTAEVQELKATIEGYELERKQAD